MSNFPNNHHKYSQYESVNGCPLTFEQAEKLADEILMWHSNLDTDDWTQSSDAYEWELRNLGLGLMELFSDPGAIRRIAMTGEATKKHIETLMKIKDIPGLSQSSKSAADVIEKLFNWR